MTTEQANDIYGAKLQAMYANDAQNNATRLQQNSLGNAAVDYYGVDRKDFENEFGTITTPEPGTELLAGAGLLVIGGVAMRRRARAESCARSTLKRR